MGEGGGEWQRAQGACTRGTALAEQEVCVSEAHLAMRVACVGPASVVFRWRRLSRRSWFDVRHAGSDSIQCSDIGGQVSRHRSQLVACAGARCVVRGLRRAWSLKSGAQTEQGRSAPCSRRSSGRGTVPCRRADRSGSHVADPDARVAGEDFAKTKNVEAAL